MEDPGPSTSREQTAVALRDPTREPSSRSSSVNEDSGRAVALTSNLEGTDVKVLANNCLVHVGTRSELTYNFSLNVGEGRDGVRSTVRQCLEGIKRDSRGVQDQGSSSLVFTGVRDLSSRWYYWLATLVALSCVGSIVAAVTFTVNNLWPPTEQDVSVVLAALRRAFWFLVFPLVTLSCMNLVSTMLLSLYRATGAQPALLVEDSPERPSTNEDRDLSEELPGGLQLMRRSFWRARPPCGAVDDDPLPVPAVVLCHTHTRSPTDSDEIACIIQGFQRYHMEERFLDDISYNFLIGADGRVYEGRGWAKVPGHARGRGRGTLAVAVIGSFVTELPPATQLDTLFRFLECGVLLGHLRRDYRLLAHCQVVATASPGAALLVTMAIWPRFLECGVLLGHLRRDYRLLAHCQVVATASPGAALLDTMATWPRFDRNTPINCSSN